SGVLTAVAAISGERLLMSLLKVCVKFCRTDGAFRLTVDMRFFAAEMPLTCHIARIRFSL
ncbi:hypothetical protein, partial [Methylobacterium dankookense]|uniref:hypothetical protein n=1 Tax=Methylobacterium dankookense TaxID=560405 RepID=UPI001EE12D8D